MLASALSTFAPRRRLLAFAVATAVLTIVQQFRLPRNVKWVKGWPLLGYLKHILTELFAYRFHDHISDLHKKLGMTLAFHILGAPVVATIDPKNLQHMLKDNFSNYVKGRVFSEPFTDLLGEGIFNVDGQKWFDQRKIASRMFTKKVFEDHIWSVVRRNTREVTEILRQADGTSICMFNLMNRFTLDTIGAIGFSKNIGSLADPSSPFLKSFDYAQDALIKRFWLNHGIPSWRLLRFFGLLWERDLQFHLDALNEYSDGIVKDLLSKGADSGDSSFVGLFVKEFVGQGLHEKDEEGFHRFMRDMVLNFLIAGRDTTAQAITWTLFELAQSPNIVQKVRDEVSSVCGPEGLAYEHIKELRYTKAVLDEGLRLHPSVPLDGKLALQRDVLPDGTIVPAGCLVGFVPYAQGRCEALWGSDAHVFRPERWLERKMPSSFEFSVFTAGPRECLGKRLAEMEMVALLATLLPRFDLSLAIKPEEVKYDTQLTLGCSSGLPMEVRVRADP